MKKWLCLIGIPAALVCLYFVFTIRDIPEVPTVAARPEETDSTIILEGMPVDVHNNEIDGESTDTSPGFSMYVEEEMYEVTEENGVTYIRAIGVLATEEDIRKGNAAHLEGLSPKEQEEEIKRLVDQELAFYYSMPVCEMVITHLADTGSADAAEKLHARMLSEWESVSEIECSEQPSGLCFFVSEGTEWNSKLEDIYFIEDGQHGCFQVTMRYFLEAAEGHGVRFRAMLKTFTVSSP